MSRRLQWECPACSRTSTVLAPEHEPIPEEKRCECGSLMGRVVFGGDVKDWPESPAARLLEAGVPVEVGVS